MAWSIFKEGGGKGVAVTWSNDLLDAIGAPKTPGNVQVIYDWEVSEGAGGKYNPLNQGPVPGHSELTSTGSQYGGGAADYVSWQAGIQGAADYLNMGNFRSIKNALVSGNSSAARNAIINSPWAASHYGHGSAFSTAAVPGEAAALPGITDASALGPMIPDTGGSKVMDEILKALGLPDVKELAERAGLILFGAILVVVGLVQLSGTREKAIEISREFVGGKVKAAKAVGEVA